MTQFAEDHDGNVSIELIGGGGQVRWGEYTGDFDNAFSLRRNGGISCSLYGRLGYSNSGLIFMNNSSARQSAKSLLSNVDSFDKYIISVDLGGKGQEQLIDLERGLYSNHAYRILPGQVNADGTISTFNLINPWGIIETELTSDEVIKYAIQIEMAEK